MTQTCCSWRRCCSAVGYLYPSRKLYRALLERDPWFLPALRLIFGPVTRLLAPASRALVFHLYILVPLGQSPRIFKFRSFLSDLQKKPNEMYDASGLLMGFRKISLVCSFLEAWLLMSDRFVPFSIFVTNASYLNRSFLAEKGISSLPSSKITFLFCFFFQKRYICTHVFYTVIILPKLIPTSCFISCPK